LPLLAVQRQSLLFPLVLDDLGFVAVREVLVAVLRGHRIALNMVDCMQASVNAYPFESHALQLVELVRDLLLQRRDLVRQRGQHLVALALVVNAETVKM
jgi:hypothetical protein